MAKRKRRDRLESALAGIRMRFGPGAIRHLEPKAAAVEVIPTGFKQLDRLLGAILFK